MQHYYSQAISLQQLHSYLKGVFETRGGRGTLVLIKFVRPALVIFFRQSDTSFLENFGD